MKLRLLAASVAAIALSGAALAQNQQPAQAAQQAPAPVPVDRNALSYAIGYDLGRSLADSGEQVDIAQVVRAVQDGFAKQDPSVQPQQMAQQLEGMQRRMFERARAAFEAASRENKTRSDQFLASNRAQAGVTTLPSGVQYREVERGSGAKPTATSNVNVQLSAKLAATGEEFIPQREATLNVGQAPLAGLREVLPLMSTGARWEVVLPPDQAYGDTPQSPIGPNQAVTLDVKLVGIQ
ncbi:FKBP-type peptidyl-prolyl cis-trans isomerase N-terminal domain-containing protein [Coralloluteibacterium thermophilus]|uniref:Peptidyl-prolyl cis-trans isomerase n=1 Tax=Coralloluteibacterium thermophilum TaxID=2707049 RepID=A0ABV9NI36_9GAMM